MALRLELILKGAGWADIQIADGEQLHTIRGVSYLSDALDDLVRIGIDIATDRGYGMAQFFHEPGSTVLIAETGWWEQDEWQSGARLSTFPGPEFADAEPTWRMAHEAPRDFVMHCASRDELARIFLGAALSVLERHGEAGYADSWNGRRGFPRRAIAALKAALDVNAAERLDEY